MHQKTALTALYHFDCKGKYLYNLSDFRMLFPLESHKTLQESLQRLTKAGFLERLCKGLYLFAFSAHKNKYLIEKIAIALRPGHYNYLSLESALSQYGVISQMPVDRLAIMATGRKGEYATTYGVLEFTHTQRNPIDWIASTLETESTLKIAKKQVALRDLKRVGRNLYLVNYEEMTDPE